MCRGSYLCYLEVPFMKEMDSRSKKIYQREKESFFTALIPLVGPVRFTFTLTKIVEGGLNTIMAELYSFKFYTRFIKNYRIYRLFGKKNKV